MDFGFGSFNGRRSAALTFDRSDPLNRGAKPQNANTSKPVAAAKGRADAQGAFARNQPASQATANRDPINRDPLNSLGQSPKQNFGQRAAAGVAAGSANDSFGGARGDGDQLGEQPSVRKRVKRAGPRFRRFAGGPSAPVKDLPAFSSSQKSTRLSVESGGINQRAKFDVEFLRKAAQTLSVEDARSVNQIVSNKSARLLATLRTMRFEPSAFSSTTVDTGGPAESPVPRAARNVKSAAPDTHPGGQTNHQTIQSTRASASIPGAPVPKIISTSVRSGAPAPAQGRYRSATNGLTIVVEKNAILPIVDGQPSIWRYIGESREPQTGVGHAVDPLMQVIQKKPANL